MGENNKSIIINAVDRSLDILEYLFHENKEVPITKISTDLKIYKSTVYRTLATLQNRGYVKQNPETDKYSLGYKAFILGTKMHAESALKEVADPYMNALNERFQEAVNLSVLNRDINGVYQSIIIASKSSKLSLNANTNLGDLNECYCSAVGKCLLAFTDGVNLDVYEKNPMKKYTEYTITSLDDLQEELLRVRREKLAIDNEEREIGLYCFGAPILIGNTAVASISLSGPTARMKGKEHDAMIEAIKKAAEDISNTMAPK